MLTIILYSNPLNTQTNSYGSTKEWRSVTSVTSAERRSHGTELFVIICRLGCSTAGQHQAASLWPLFAWSPQCWRNDDHSLQSHSSLQSRKAGGDRCWLLTLYCLWGIQLCSNASDGYQHGFSLWSWGIKQREWNKRIPNQKHGWKSVERWSESWHSEQVKKKRLDQRYLGCDKSTMKWRNRNNITMLFKVASNSVL